MGTWGDGILSDDFARDVYDEYLERYNAGGDHPTVFAAVKKRFRSDLQDSDYGPLFWLAVAKAQWDCGDLNPEVHVKVQAIIAQGEGLDRWREQGSAGLAKRQRALAGFLERLGSPNPRPRRRRPLVRKEAPYPPGTCLALRLRDGEYGAAIVLAVDKSVKTEDISLVAVLHHKSPSLPTQSVFEARRWLILTHHNWKNEPARHWCLTSGHSANAHLLEVVGSTKIRWRDPTKARFHGPWQNLGADIFNQDAWDHGYRGDIAGA
jgi:hypothetical protein